jgi:hypothetical protein
MSSPLSPTAEPGSELSPIGTVGEEAPKMSHQVSQASILPPGTRIATVELPSPISVRSDDQNKQLPDGPRLNTPAEKKQIMMSSSSPVSPPPRDEHPAFSETASAPEDDRDALPTEVTPTAADPTGVRPAEGLAPPASPPPGPTSPSAVKIAPFKEIMALPTAAERIERLEETRDVFSKIDSGLVSWLVVMTQVPEHANASWSLRDNLTNEMYETGQKAGEGGNGLQRNPSLPASAGLGSGRPMSGMASGSQFSTVDLRHSGKEVGAKGKELLMAAGKAGKGLFSKGKSKLRSFER